MTLTPEQQRLFRHNGFLKLPQRLPEETVALLKETIHQHIREEVAPIVRDKLGRVVRISNLWDRGSPLQEVITCPEILDPLASLLGPNIEYIKNRHNHATLRLAEEGTVYFHRDVLQWTRSIVTVIVYLEDTPLENGCTLVVPGTQINSLEEDECVRKAGLLEQAVPVPMPAGGLLAIDSLLMHSAGTNATAATRMSMTLGYHSVDELSDIANPNRVLVHGQRIYMGNDYRKP